MTDRDSMVQQLPRPPYKQELAVFAEELRALHIRCGSPSLRDVQAAAPAARPLSSSAVSEVLAGKRLPRLDFLIALVQTLLALEDGRAVRREDSRVKRWRSRWEDLERARVNARLSSSSAGGVRSAAPPPQTYHLALTLEGHTQAVETVAFSSDGSLLATAGSDGTVRLWDPATGLPIRAPFPSRVGPVDAVARPRDRDGHARPVVGLAFSPDGQLLASASTDMTVLLWNPATGRPVREPLVGHAGYVYAVAFSSEGRLLATASHDMTVLLWDPATGRPVGRPLVGHTGYVMAVAFSPDGWLLASSSTDGTVRLWHPATGRSLGEPLVGHTGRVYAVAFSPDGQLLASVGSDQTVRLWLRDGPPNATRSFG